MLDSLRYGLMQPREYDNGREGRGQTRPNFFSRRRRLSMPLGDAI